MLPIRVPDVFHRGAVGAQVVGDDLFWLTVALHQFLEEFQRCLAVSTLGDEDLENFAFMVDSTPHVMCLADDFCKDLVEMPLPIRLAAHPLGSGFRDRELKYPDAFDGFLDLA